MICNGQPCHDSRHAFVTIFERVTNTRQLIPGWAVYKPVVYAIAM